MNLKNMLIIAPIIMGATVLTGCAIEAGAVETASIAETVETVEYQPVSDVETFAYEAEAVELEVVEEEVKDTRVWITLAEYADLLQASGHNGDHTHFISWFDSNPRPAGFTSVAQWMCLGVGSGYAYNREMLINRMEREVNWRICYDVYTGEVIFGGDFYANAASNYYKPQIGHVAPYMNMNIVIEDMRR